MADLNVLEQALARAEKISGQLVERMRVSLRELGMIHKDTQQAMMTAGDAPGLRDTLEQLNTAFNTVLNPTREIIKTVDALQDSLREIAKTIKQLKQQGDEAQAKAKVDDNASQQSPDVISGVRR